MLEETPLTPPELTPGSTDIPEGMTPQQKRAVVITLLVLVLVVTVISLALYYLLTANPDKTEQIRDVFIIVLAVQSLMMGLVMVILILQLARLINLIQNEIRPILDSTNETVSHLRGTTMFLSENVVEPVIKMNEYMAGFTQFFATIGLVRRSSKKNNKNGE